MNSVGVRSEDQPEVVVCTGELLFGKASLNSRIPQPGTDHIPVGPERLGRRREYKLTSHLVTSALEQVTNIACSSTSRPTRPWEPDRAPFSWLGPAPYDVAPSRPVRSRAPPTRVASLKRRNLAFNPCPNDASDIPRSRPHPPLNGRHGHACPLRNY